MTTTQTKTQKALAPVAYEEGIKTLLITSIEVPPEGNVTRPEGVGDVADLASAIKASGQQTPIIVQRLTGNTYKLAAGFRRMAALTLLKATTVEARVLASSDEAQRVLANVTENENARKEISPLGRLAGYEALSAQGYSVSEIARIAGRAEDFIRDHLRISKGADEVKAALALPEDADGSISWAVARLVLRLPKAQQAHALKKVSGLSVVKAREVLKELRDGEKAAPKSSKTSHDSEGEGDENGESGISPEVVANKLAMFVGLGGDTVAALRQALDSETPDAKHALKVVNALAKSNQKLEGTLRALCGDKVFETAMKEADKRLKAA